MAVPEESPWFNCLMSAVAACANSNSQKQVLVPASRFPNFNLDCGNKSFPAVFQMGLWRRFSHILDVSFLGKTGLDDATYTSSIYHK